MPDQTGYLCFLSKYLDRSTSRTAAVTSARRAWTVLQSIASPWTRQNRRIHFWLFKHTVQLSRSPIPHAKTPRTGRQKRNTSTPLPISHKGFHLVFATFSS